MPRGQPSPVPHLASALAAQQLLRRLGGNPSKTLEQAPHSPHPRLQASAHLLKIQPCNLAINFATNRSVWLAGQKSSLVGAGIMLCQIHKINTQCSWGDPPCLPRRPQPGLASATGQTCPRASLPTREVPALPITKNPDVETRTRPFPPQKFPSPIAPWLGRLIAQQNTQHGVPHLISGKVCRRTACSPG